MPQTAKTNIAYRSRDEVLVGTDFGGDGSCLTDSGYPRVIKSWKRGTPIETATVVFEGEQADVAASQYAYHDRGFVHEFQLRSITFYTSEYLYRGLTQESIKTVSAADEGSPFAKVPIPEDASLGTFADSALVTLRTDWQPPGYQYQLKWIMTNRKNCREYL
jgi:prolyl oligopeptidase